MTTEYGYVSLRYSLQDYVFSVKYGWFTVTSVPLLLKGPLPISPMGHKINRIFLSFRKSKLIDQSKHKNDRFDENMIAIKYVLGLFKENLQTSTSTYNSQ